MTIPFDVPKEFAARLASGELQRFGSILKDVSSGKIVGHLQETAGLQDVIQRSLSAGPLAPVGIALKAASVAQNAYIGNKISALQSMLATMQVLQIATLASSVSGIGVTAATAAMLSKRLNQIDVSLEAIGDRISVLPDKLRDSGLRETLGTLQTALDRLQEAEIRSDAVSVVRAEEERLNFAFDKLNQGICNIVVQAQVDAELLQCLLAGLALCGSAEIKALVWLDHKVAAEQRSKEKCKKLQDLAFLMPRHTMAKRLAGGPEQALAISNDCNEIRLRAASQPDLVRTLIAREINGRDFVERVQAEEDEPFLVLRRD